MTKMDDDPYAEVMKRDATESERLDRQHLLVKKTLGYLLHPKVASSLGSNSIIADVGTGTGVVLLDLAKSLPPTCELYGLDISDSQFPSAEGLPDNVSFHVANAKQPFDSKWHGKFDAVILRYLNVAMTPADWEPTTRNIFDILKPGGWVHWIEADWHQACHFMRLDPTVPESGAAQEAAELIGESARFLEYAGRQLAGIMRDVGLQNIVHEVVSNDRLPESRVPFSQMNSGPMFLTMHKIEGGKGPDGKSPEYLEKLKSRLLADTEAGAVFSRYDIHVFLGQKP